jgi:hypothetical protein
MGKAAEFLRIGALKPVRLDISGPTFMFSKRPDRPKPAVRSLLFLNLHFAFCTLTFDFYPVDHRGIP